MLLMEKSYINIPDIPFKTKRFSYVATLGNATPRFGLKSKTIIAKEDHETSQYFLPKCTLNPPRKLRVTL